MVVAGYLLYNTNLRIKDDGGIKFVGLPNGPPNKGFPTPTTVKERAEQVFQLIKEKMKNLVIINSSLSTFEIIQACVQVAEKYAKNVMVIPSLLARITYALENLSNLRSPSKEEIILIVTITPAFNEFVILRRNKNNLQLYIAECESYKPNKCKKMFPKYYATNQPHSTIFVVHDSQKAVAEQLKEQYSPRNYHFRSFEKWDYILLFGGMLWAMDDKDGFDSRYHLANFSCGFETTTKNNIEKTEKQHILLADRSSLPCKIGGFAGVPQKIKIYYSEQYYMGNEHIFSDRRLATERNLPVSSSSKEIIGYIDSRGVPYAPPPKYIMDEKKQPPPVHIQQMNNKDAKATVAVVPKCLSISSPSTSNAKTISHSSSSSITKPTVSCLQSKIKFIFLGNFYAIHVLRNGITKVLADSFGNEWTPMCFSMVEKAPTFGREAQNHCERFHKHVIYDIFEVIGKPLNEIKINSKWGFELIVSDDIVYFQIETPFGARLFSQEIILASFLKAMKLQSETNLNAEIRDIEISTNFVLNKSQEELFVKAAIKNGLKILSFACNVGH